VRRIATLWGLGVLTATVASFSTGTMPLRPDSSRAELTKLGQEYGDLQLWVSAIAASTDTISDEHTERARVLADQLARLMRPLEKDFERTTAALSTTQLEQILPLWERMAFAHAGFALLQEEAADLGNDPSVHPAELRELTDELAAVLDFAAEVQQMVLEQLTMPIISPIRVS
jgi:hypothetical protein